MNDAGKVSTYFRDSEFIATDASKPSVIKHLIVECSLISEKYLSHSQLLSFVSDFCDKFELHIVTRSDHQFSPYGSTIVFVLEESHIAIHSWPEHGYFHCDIVTCTAEPLDCTTLRKFIADYFTPGYIGITRLKY